MSKFELKSAELSKMSKALLHNRFVLFFVFALAIGNIFHFAFTYDLTSVAIFILAGFLTSFFSKNMIVIMVVAMVVSNILRLGRNNEGFGNHTKEEDSFDVALEGLNQAIEENFEDEEEDGEDGEYDTLAALEMAIENLPDSGEKTDVQAAFNDLMTEME